MSTLRVTNLQGGSAGSAPNLPDGAVVTGVVTATSFSGSGANLTGIDATALKDGNGTVRVQANTTGAVVTGIATATTFSGNITGVAATFSGAVSVGGTLTYEDVTNVDSVGLITARNGINISGSDLKVGAAFTVGQSGVVTATSFIGSGANLTGIDAAPQVKLNASGTIAANKPTVVNTDGTVSEVTSVISGLDTPTYTSQNNIANPADYPVGIQIPGTDTMLMAYQYASGSKAGYARVMTRTGTSLTQTSNEPAFDGSQVRNIGVVWDDNANRGVIFYVDIDDSSKMKARVCQVSGNTLSFGSITNFPANETGETNYLNHRAVYDPDTQKIIIGFSDGSSGSSWVGKAYVCTIDPSTNGISFGSVSTIYNSYNVRRVDLAYDTTNNKVVAMIAADTSGNDAWVVSKVGTVSGTSITWGTENDISTPQSNNASMVWMSEQEKLFCVYESDQSNKLFARVGTVSGTNVTWGTAAQCSSNNTTLIRASATINAAYDTFGKLPVVTWRATYSGDSVGFVAAKSISGTTVTYGDAVELSGGGGTRGPFVCSMNTSSGLPVMWRNTSGPGKYVFVSIAAASTNVTDENFIGFSAASYTNGQEATIQITGNTNSNQSGLTTGQNYFVQNNGTLGLAAASPRVYAGTALSATKIAVSKESAPASGLDVIARWDMGADYGQNYFSHTGLDNTTYIKYRLELSQMQFVGNGSKKVGLRVYDKDGTLRTDSVYRYNTQKKSFTTNSITQESSSGNDKWLWVGTSNNDRDYYDASIVWHNRPNPDNSLAHPIMRADIYQNAWYSFSETMQATMGTTNWISGFYIYNYTDSTNICFGKATLYGYKY